MYNRAGPVAFKMLQKRGPAPVLLWATAAVCACVSLSMRAQSNGQAPPQTTPNPARPTGAVAPPPTATGLILGQVVDAAGGSVSSAIVSISTANATAAAGVAPAGPLSFAPRRMLTTADGRFLFTGLPKATYTIDVTKSGYVGSGPGKFRPDGGTQPIELAEGERNGSLKITMWKYAVISGTLSDEAGEPFVGATIWSLRRSYLTGRPQMTDGPSALTDDRGYFRLANLLPGDYMICVVASQTTLPASLVDAYGQARLAGGTAVTDLSRSISASAIGFTAGTSTPGIRVGDLVVQTVGSYSRGMVPPAPDQGGPLLSFQTTFYPSVVNMSQADVITLTSGQERTGADIRLKLVPIAPVAGTVIGPNGPMANVGVRLSPEYSPDLGNELSFETALTVSDAAGRFRFMGVPAGQYVLRALNVPQPAPFSIVDGVARPVVSPIPSEPTLWANVPIAVSSEGLRDLAIKLNTGFRISGKIVFEGTTAKPPAPATLQNSQIMIVPADGHQVGYAGALRGRVDQDGTFSTYEIPPGRYIIRYSATGQGWTLKSAMFEGRDVTSVPLDVRGDISGLPIALTDRPTELSGTVRDVGGKIDPTAAVVVFPADRADWSSFGDAPRRLRLVRASAAGAFFLRGLPAGQYLVAAVPDGQAGEWQNPATLELLARNAVAVVIADAEKKVQDVTSRKVR
jgi:hypothetical protein